MTEAAEDSLAMPEPEESGPVRMFNGGELGRQPQDRVAAGQRPQYPQRTRLH